MPKNGYKYIYSDNNYLFKDNNRNTRKRCKTCSKLIIITPFQRKVPFHIETSQNQMNGFYMKCNTGLKLVRKKAS